jgi:large subunit ribosomal protein L16
MALLIPKKVKHRKQRRRTHKGKDKKATELHFGNWGLKAMAEKWITSNQIEAARRSIIRYLRKGGKVWIRIFPNKAVTQKGTEVPMGGGKGAVDHYVYPVRSGRIIFEISGIPETDAREALRKAGNKLPLKTKFVKR